MPDGQVRNVDVVPHAGTVAGGIVGSVDRDLGQLAHSHLGDVGDQVIGNAVRVLADAAARVRPGGVEIAEQRDLPAGLGPVDVAQHVLDEQLGATVGVHGEKWEILQHRHRLRVSVDRGRGAEDDGANAVPPHDLEQREAAGDVVVEVAQRLRHRLSHCLEPREVQHRLDVTLGEDRLEPLGIPQVDRVEGQRAAGELLHPSDRRLVAVAEIVHHHHVVARP